MRLPIRSIADPRARKVIVHHWKLPQQVISPRLIPEKPAWDAEGTGRGQIVSTPMSPLICGE